MSDLYGYTHQAFCVRTPPAFLLSILMPLFSAFHLAATSSARDASKIGSVTHPYPRTR